jgi:hypothetical protein
VTGRSVREAVHADIPELVRLRALLFTNLAGTWGAPPPGSTWRDACADALAAALADTSMRVIVSDTGTGLASCGIAAVDRRLPSPYNPGGTIGHVFGIVTDPAAAGRGDHVVRPAFRRLGVVDGDQAGHPLPVRLLPG